MKKFFIVFMLLTMPLFAQWEKVNGPESGWVKLILKAPNNDLLAFPAYGGGIYKSSDNGTSWALSVNGLLLDGEYYANILSAKLGQDNKIYIYAEYPIGKTRVFYSSDNGDNWIPLAAQVWGGGITEALADGTLYQFIGHEIAKSTDSGNSWSFLTTSGLSTTAIKYTLLLSNNVFFVVSDFVYKSVDAGITWKKLTIPNNNELFKSPDGTLFYSPLDLTIQASTDSGETWTTKYTSGFSFTIPSMAFAGGGVIFAGKNSGSILKSTDNGNTWNEFSTGLEPTAANNSMVITNSNDIVVGTIYGIFKSSITNAGFLYSSSGYSASSVYDMFEDSNGNLYSVTLDAVYKSTDIGTTWSRIIARSTLYKSVATNGNNIFLGKNDGVMRSSNGGATWAYVNNGLTIGGQQYVNHLEVTAAGTILAGTGGGLFRSTNNGDSWSKIAAFSSNDISYITIKPNGDIFVSSNLNYYKSTDDGVTWNLSPVGHLNNPSLNLDGQINIIDYLSSSNGTLFINFQSNKILKSTDNGLNWDLKNLPSGSGNVQKMFIGDSDSLFVITTIKVLLSTDGGETYSNYNNGNVSNSLNGGFRTKNGNIFVMSNNSSIFRKENLITSIENLNSQIPDNFILTQNYPNPFNPETTIGYELQVSGYTTLKVYDVLGREVASLVDEYKQAGEYIVRFNVETRLGESLPSGVSAKGGYASGVYFYTLRVSPSASSGHEFRETKKMLLLK